MIIFATTYKELLGLVHIYSSLGDDSFLNFWNKAIKNNIYTFQIYFFGIETLCLVCLGKIIEIKLALEIIIKMEQVDFFYLGKWTNSAAC